jgi:uncharacterized protein
LRITIYPDGAILDEIQRAPDLISYIQTRVDSAQNRTAKYILTGSAQFEMMEKVTQSLAGRTALVKLLPLTVAELTSYSTKLDDLLYTGFYPRIYHEQLNPNEALSFYVNTYIERDVRSLLNVKDLLSFEKFLRLCATRTGQVLNLSGLGNECGISHNTAREWVSVLEASYIIFRLSPHFNNFSKRLTKSPKLYFYDVGLASYLLGITNKSQLNAHPLRGSLFETLVVSELIKARFNEVKNNNLYYFRDSAGREVDVILDYPLGVRPIEIKASETLHNDFFKNIKYYKTLNKEARKGVVVYAGDRRLPHSDGTAVSYTEVPSLIEENEI